MPRGDGQQARGQEESQGTTHTLKDMLAYLGHNFPVNVEQFLDGVVVAGHDEADDGHEQVREALAVENELNQLLQGGNLLWHFLVF